jgi:hypothetical protein
MRPTLVVKPKERFAGDFAVPREPCNPRNGGRSLGQLAIRSQTSHHLFATNPRLRREILCKQLIESAFSPRTFRSPWEPGWIVDRICCLSIAAEVHRMAADCEPAFKRVPRVLETHAAAAIFCTNGGLSGSELIICIISPLGPIALFGPSSAGAHGSRTENATVSMSRQAIEQ